MVVSSTLATAEQYLQAGEYDKAEPLYRAVLQDEPQLPANRAAALHGLGLLYAQTNQVDMALNCLDQAIAVDAEQAIFHNNRGNMLKALSRVSEALESYYTALRLQPDSGFILFNVGKTWVDYNEPEKALPFLEQSIRVQPNYAPANHYLGKALQRLHRFTDAQDCFARCLELQFGPVELLYNLGVNYFHLRDYLSAFEMLKSVVEADPHYPQGFSSLALVAYHLRDYALAERCYQTAQLLNTTDPLLHSNWALLYEAQGQLDKAITQLETSTQLAPDNPDSWNALGSLYQNARQFEKAEDAFKRALHFSPEHPYYLNNMALNDEKSGKYIEARALYEHVLSIAPDKAEIHLNYALFLLLTEDYATGWPEYEWRLEVERIVPKRDFPKPRWEGENLTGKTILIASEQGFGDTFYFLRYLPLVKARGATVILECQPELKRLLKNTPGVDHFTERKNDKCAPADVTYDCYIYLMSLPLLFETRINTIPAIGTPLTLAKAWLQKAKKQVKTKAKLKVGLVWSGNPDNPKNPIRRCPLSLLAELAKVPSIQLFSLQKGFSESEQKRLEESGIVDLGSECADFADTAAIIANLDVVISIDTAVAHLTGILHQPLWVILSKPCDWRWSHSRLDSPWYPTARLFRQPKPDDWAAVIQALQHELTILRDRQSLRKEI